MNRPPPYSKKKLDAIGEELAQCFSSGQGILFGSSSVVSRKVHIEPRERPGLVHILKEKDAGETYMYLRENDQIVHIDVLHCHAEINIAELNNHVIDATSQFLQVINPDPRLLSEPLKQAALELFQRINVMTDNPEGYQHRSLRRVSQEPNSHIHILANLPPKYYPLIYCIVEATEKALAYQGVKLRPVKQIIHIHAKKKNHHSTKLKLHELININMTRRYDSRKSAQNKC